MAKTKKEFLDELSAHLQNVPDAERIKLLEYYNELYLDKIENGQTEAQVVAGFGSPAAAAGKFLTEMATEAEALNAEKADGIYPNQSPAGAFLENSRQKVQGVAKKTKSLFKNKTFWTIYLSGFVITIPLTIAALGVAIGLLSGALGLIIGLVAGVFSVCVGLSACLAAGLYGIASAVYTMSQSFEVGLVQLASAFAAIAVGFFGIYISIKILKLVKKLFKKEKRHGAN